MVSHLDMFYETRASVHVSNTNPSNNPNSELNFVPEIAKICFKDGENRVIDSHSLEAPNGKGYETAQFLIQRAMLDPDAVVIAMGEET